MAMENKNSNGKRFLITEKTVDLIHIAKVLKSNNFNVSTLVVPDFIVRLFSFFFQVKSHCKKTKQKRAFGT